MILPKKTRSSLKGAQTGTGTGSGRAGNTSRQRSPSSRLMRFQGKLIFNLDMEYHTSLTAIISYLCLNCTSRDILLGCAFFIVALQNQLEETKLTVSLLCTVENSHQEVE